MSQELSLFDFKGHNIRVFGTTDEPWFLAKDIAQVLGIKNHYDFISSLDEDQKYDLDTIDTIGRTQKMTVINESAVYEMVFNSRKTEAKQFRKWVCNEVLPSIRKKGRYELEEKNKALEDEVKTLKKRRFMTYEKNTIRIIDRLFHLNKIKKEDYDKIMKSQRGLTDDGRECIYFHPNRGLLQFHILQISNNISNMKRKVEGDRPNFRYGDKCNAYFLRDYELYGDNVIHDYFEERPFETWGINMNW